jgi:type IV secretion system protein VirB6
VPIDISGLANLYFYERIQTYLRERLDDFQGRVLGEFAQILGVTALSILTIWIFWQGWRVVSGRSRESMMGLVGDSLRAMLIIGVATGWAGNTTTLYSSLTDGLGKVVYGAVTGSNDDIDSMYHIMDANLAVTTAALGAIAAVEKGRDGSGHGDATSDQILIEATAAFGAGGPALAGGTMITLNKLAMAMFIGFGPFFIMCLLFDVTKGLFQKWLFYGVGTMFALAVLYVVLIIATEMMLAVAASFWLGSALADNSEGMRTIAIQTGGSVSS